MSARAPGLHSVAVTIVDSVTDLTSAARGTIAITGSHGGVFAGRYAVNAGIAAAGFSDAGPGRDAAGIGGLAELDRVETPGFAVGVRTARIGDGADTLASGILSHVNTAARKLGIAVGQSTMQAVEIIEPHVTTLRRTARGPMPAEESRVLIASEPIRVWALDSASLVHEDDSGSIVLTGSHGGLPGGRPERALKVDAALAAFNDAGVGKDCAGIARLACLDARGIAAVTVAADSARIGSGTSTYRDGVISYLNERAADRGCRVGERLATAIARIS